MPVNRLSVLLLWMLSSCLEAAIISLSGSTAYLSDEATPVPQGSLLSVGYFNDSEPDFGSLLGQSWDAILGGSYTEVSTGLINPFPGEWAGGGNAAGIEGQQLYVWIFSASSWPITVGATEFGLFTGSSSNWLGKGDGGILLPEFNFLSPDSVDSAVYGSDLGFSIALAPATVPEPAHMAFLMGLIMIAVGWRRHLP